MSKWRVEVRETVVQETVYIVDAESEDQAKEIVETDHQNQEILSFFVDDRIINSFISVTPDPEQ